MVPRAAGADAVAAGAVIVYSVLFEQGHANQHLASPSAASCSPALPRWWLPPGPASCVSTLTSRSPKLRKGLTCTMSDFPEPVPAPPPPQAPPSACVSALLLGSTFLDRGVPGPGLTAGRLPLPAPPLRPPFPELNFVYRAPKITSVESLWAGQVGGGLIVGSCFERT